MNFLSFSRWSTFNLFPHVSITKNISVYGKYLKGDLKFVRAILEKILLGLDLQVIRALLVICIGLALGTKHIFNCMMFVVKIRSDTWFGTANLGKLLGKTIRENKWKISFSNWSRAATTLLLTTTLTLWHTLKLYFISRNFFYTCNLHSIGFCIFNLKGKNATFYSFIFDHLRTY